MISALLVVGAVALIVGLVWFGLGYWTARYELSQIKEG
jgi:uncharacterized membrane protein YiaA